MSSLTYQYDSINYLCMPPPSYYKDMITTSDHNSMISEDLDEEQEKRNKLKEQATNRLRQKILEKKYETLMSQIVEIQSKLDIIKLETQISFKSMNSNHLDHFEKRLENHKYELKNMIEKMEPQESSSQSSSISTFSSILSLKDEDYFVNIGQKKKRRSRQSRQSRQQQEQEEQEQSSKPQQDDDGTVSDIGRNNNELIVLHSIQDNTSNHNGGLIKNDTYSLLDKRNALDDTLSFLNGLASDTDDGGFRKDIIDLLNLHPIKSSTHTHHYCFIKNPLSHLFVTSWKWIRFALIMILAILINLKQGPSLF